MVFNVKVTYASGTTQVRPVVAEDERDAIIEMLSDPQTGPDVIGVVAQRTKHSDEARYEKVLLGAERIRRENDLWS